MKSKIQEDDIKFVHLSQIDKAALIELMNNETVRRQLPLLKGLFSEENCRAFLSEKQQLWDEHGFGPWAFLIRGEFAGWGGLQFEQGEVDFGLVLHPKFWGCGRIIFNKIKGEAFDQKRFESITILLPPSRPNSKAIARLGFVKEGPVTIGQETFIKYRLLKK